MKDKFFDRLDWAAFWTATVATGVVYLLTLGPSVGLEDSGELATAAAHLGVPHAPGYPFWTLCSWLFCKLFFWVKYMGHPTPAWSVSCFSAVAGAFAAGCTSMLICRSSRDFVEDVGAEGAPSASGQPGFVHSILAFGGGVAGALTFALSPVEWSQSTIVEIYSLNALFLMWVFLLSYRWMKRPSDKILWITAFVFGLGLTNYQVLLFAIVPLALIILVKNTSMFRDVFIYLVPVAMTYQLLKVGCLQQASWRMQADVIAKHYPLASTSACPSTPMLVIGLAVLVGSLVAAAVLRSRGEGERARAAAMWGGGAGAALMLLAGTLFTGPNEWSGVTASVAPLVEPVKYAIVAAFAAASVVAAALAALQDGEDGLMDGNKPKFLAASAVLALVAIFVAASVPQAGIEGYQGPAYPWAKSTLAFTGLVVSLFAMCWFTKRGLCFAIPVAGLHIAAFILLRHGAMNGLTHPQSWWFCWPVAWNFVLLALAWLTLPNGRSVAGAALFAQLGVAFYAYMPIVSELRNPPMNWAYPRTWEGFKHAIMREQYAAIVFPEFKSVGDFFAFVFTKMSWYCRDVCVQFTDYLIPFMFVPFAAGWALVPRERRRAFWQWMVAAAVCFLMMSVLLILLADVKGSVGDGFIQKVKFISSHAMIALWIGYGLFFASAFLMTLLERAARAGHAFARRTRLVACTLAAVAIAVAFASPIIQNWTDERMVFELGGCEQNGHTFGWQFGAYQLDGWKAIREQIAEDEEPLPDPEWPEPMEPFSIFFGGTDPGRFVPTYMIYSAEFRPDIYLITQNALADDTYMRVERDLYGDEIWIPSSIDSSKAFEQYVEEVDRGLRPAPPKGNLVRQNGRVQVVGTEAVMEINAILSRMMFDHDRLRHAFYLEESFPMRWMDDFLSPHGLIMKINKDRTPYDRKTAEKDREFWDWYVRRLIGDPAFRRDFAAQKSMARLRISIAKQYVNKGPRALRSARQAFRDSFVLSQLSDCGVAYVNAALREERWDVASDAVENVLLPNDPNDAMVRSMRGEIGRMRAAAEIIARLEPLAKAGTLGRAQTLNLASCYAVQGRYADAADAVRPFADQSGSPQDILFIASVLIRGGDSDNGSRALERYVRAVPGADPEQWILAARHHLRAGRRGAAARCILDAPQAARNMFVEGINADGDRELIDISKGIENQRKIKNAKE